MKKIGKLFLAGAALLMVFQANSAVASTTADVGGITMGSTLVAAAGDRLLGGTVIYSPRRNYYIAFQADGNLVIYRVGAPDVAIWSSGSGNAPGSTAIFQPDGNLVIYRDVNNANSWVWASGTGGNSNGFNVSQVRLWDDGRLTIEGASGIYYQGYPDRQTYPSTTLPSFTPYCASPGNRQWNTVWYNWANPPFFGTYQLNQPFGSCALN